ncbi:hypothetical protein evm_006207 [Chilo suppressalis]|nr:hypothetical protein evm_006207 [Chilo suppressalis]
MATWNINGLTPNKYETELVMIQQNLDVLLISEAHCTSATNLKFRNYNCYVTLHPDGTGHADSAIIIRKSLKHHLMPEYRTPHIQATTIAIETNKIPLNITSVYSPPKYKITQEMYTEFFKTLGDAAGVNKGDENNAMMHLKSNNTPCIKMGKFMKQVATKSHRYIESQGDTSSQRLQSAHNLSESYLKDFDKLNKRAKEFLIMQLRLVRKNVMARRFSLNDKLFALTLWKQSPKGYRLLEKMFALPNKRTLKRLSGKIDFTSRRRSKDGT